MKPATESTEPRSASTSESLRKKMIELLVMALPTAVVGRIVLWVIERFTSQPWQVLWVVVPLAGLSYIVWKMIISKGHAELERSLVVFTSCYLLIFFILAGSSFLDLWQRSLVGYEGTAPRNFLAMNRAGDWRYFFAKEKPGRRDFIVVTRDPAKALDESRYETAHLIKVLTEAGPKGIALDYFPQYNTDPALDELVCEEIRKANNKSIRVFVGFGFEFNRGEPIKVDIAPNLQACLPDSTQAHLVGYAESDTRIRMVPLYFKNDRSMEALSLKIAEDMDGPVPRPDNGLVQFIKPDNDIDEVTETELLRNRQERGRLRDKFVLVGERSEEQDIFATPYGKMPGVIIHAFTVHSLRNNHFIRRAPWMSGFSMIFLGCYLMMILFNQKVPNRKIALISLLASAIIFAASAFAMYFWLVWVDIIYPIAAIWLLFPLLIGLRRISRSKIQPAAPSPPLPDAGPPSGTSSSNAELAAGS
jgi:CHASE2 domain-containing sensor protein